MELPFPFDPFDPFNPFFLQFQRIGASPSGGCSSGVGPRQSKR